MRRSMLGRGVPGRFGLHGRTMPALVRMRPDHQLSAGRNMRRDSARSQVHRPCMRGSPMPGWIPLRRRNMHGRLRGDGLPAEAGLPESQRQRRREPSQMRRSLLSGPVRVGLRVSVEDGRVHAHTGSGGRAYGPTRACRGARGRGRRLALQRVRIRTGFRADRCRRCSVRSLRPSSSSSPGPRRRFKEQGLRPTSPLPTGLAARN